MNTDNKLLCDLLSSTQEYKQLSALVRQLFTESELSELDNRIKIITLLRSGLTQRQVANELKVGIATVSRGAKALKNHPNLFGGNP